jgi:RimJ/RimL family protein N-acetyltransferase
MNEALFARIASTPFETYLRFQEAFMEKISKSARLKDGTEVTIRTLGNRDASALLSFFRGMPEDDRLFLNEDVTQSEVIERWIEENESGTTFSIVGERNAAIIANATFHLDKYGWHRDMAEIRCAVAREFQHKGLGTILVRELVAHAEKEGVNKITAKMMDCHASAQKAFKKLGFKQEYALKDFVIDLKGKPHTLVIMVNDVAQLWKKMEDLLLDYDTKTNQWAV